MFLILGFILFGIAISRPNYQNLSYTIQKDLDEYENHIDNNQNAYLEHVVIEANIANKIGKKVDSTIISLKDKIIVTIKNVFS